MEMDVGGTSVSDGEGCEDTHSGNNGPRREMVGATGSNAVGKLKRSNSAPMINQLLPQEPISAPSTASSSNSIMGLNRESSLCDVSAIQPRARRLSANFGPVSPLSPSSSRSAGRMRVCQLKEEEGMDIVNREAAHERTVRYSLEVDQTLSQSWEDLALSEERKSLSNQASSLPKKDYTDQLSLTITSSTVGSSQGASQGACAASPTRVGRQCFSPSLQQPVRNHSFCPSPSPTKKTTFTTRRSVSPISLRPSALGGLKRKCDIEESFITPNKRLSTCGPDRCSGGLLITHTHSLESTPSPAGGGSLGSVGTPESVCSSGSPGPPPRSYSPAPTPDPPPHLFKPVSPALSTSHASTYGHVGEQSESFMSAGGSKSSSMGEGSDTSSDAMMTEDAPMTGPGSQDLKGYQDMDLSESQPQETLNI